MNTTPARPAVAVLALLVLSLAATRLGAADAPAVKPDQELLQGTWSVVGMSLNAEDVPAETAKDMKMTLKFAGEVVTSGEGDGKGKPASFKLDPTKTPKEIKITPTEGDEKGKTYNGIYELAGDTLTIAFAAAPGGPTPTDLKPAEKKVVQRLERAK